MVFRSLILALALTTGVAQAQVTAPPAAGTTTPSRATRPTSTTPATTPTTPGATTTPATTAAPATPARTRRTLAERFAAANTTNDGKLTLEQARAGRLRAVVRDWDQIDTAKVGYVTLDQIKAHQAAQRAARRAARTTTTTPPATH